MIHRPIGFLEVRRAVLSNLQQPGRKCDSALTTDTFQTFPHRFGDCFRHALSRKVGELLREFVRFLVLNVQAHCGAILPYLDAILPPGQNFISDSWALRLNKIPVQPVCTNRDLRTLLLKGLRGAQTVP